MFARDLLGSPDICGCAISNTTCYYQETRLSMYRRELIDSVLRSASLSTGIEIRNPINHGITRLDIDKHEQNLLLAGSSNGNVLLYNLATNTCISGGSFSPIQWKSSHRGVVTNVQWYHNDNGACITSAFDGRVLVWDTGSFEVAAEFDLQDKVYCSSLRTDAANNLIAIGTGTKSVRLCDLNSGDLSHTLPHTSAVFCLDWSPQGGNILATGTIDGAAKVWDIRKSGHGALLSLDWQQDHTVANRSFTGGGLNNFRFTPREQSRDLVSRAHISSVLGLKYSSCGNFLVTAGKDRKLRLWNSHNGSLYPTQFDHGCARHALPFQMDLLRSESSSSNDVFLCPGEQHSVVMYPMHSPCISGAVGEGEGAAINVLQGHVNPVRTAVFRNNGMFQVISGSSDGMILVWDSLRNSPQHLQMMREQDEQAEVLSQQKHAADRLGLSLLTQRTGLNSVAGVNKRQNPLVEDYWSDQEEDLENRGEGSVANANERQRFGVGASAKTSLLVEPGGLLRSRYPDDSDGDTATTLGISATDDGGGGIASAAASSDDLDTAAILNVLDNMPSYLGAMEALAGDSGSVIVGASSTARTNPAAARAATFSSTSTHRTLTIGGKRYRIRYRGPGAGVGAGTGTGTGTGTGAGAGADAGTSHTNDDIVYPDHPVVRAMTDSEMFDRISSLQKRRRFEKSNPIAVMMSQMFPDKYK